MHLTLKSPLPGPFAQSEMASAQRMPFVLGDVPQKAVEAAVLALLFPTNEGRNTCELMDWAVLLIRRTSYEGVHSGQIAFPGGKRESGDKDHWDTACRETHEEVGIGDAYLQRIGELTRLYVPASNFVIYPFMALVLPGATLTIDPREVVEYRQIPLRALDPAKAVLLDFNYEGGKRPAPAWQYGSFTIWGATAMMLAELYRTVDQGLLVRE